MADDAVGSARRWQDPETLNAQAIDRILRLVS